jgi:transcriptional regulator with XRE-family HTH domain
MPIKERMKEVRKTVGLTQAKFAERIAVSTGYLAAMEIGDKKVNERTIRLVGAAFSVDEHWLRTGEGTMYNDSAAVDLAKLIGLFNSLSPKFQTCALIQLEALSELDNKNKA